MTNANSPTPPHQLLESDLLAECTKLKSLMRYDEAAGFYFWPEVFGFRFSDGANECGRCTNGAKLIAKKFGGFVAGHLITPEDSRSLVGADVFGHDFAVVGDFIVDWWGWEYEQSLLTPVLLRAKGVALGKYKPEEDWEVLPQQDFRE